MSQTSQAVFLRIWQIVGDKKRNIPAMVPLGANTVWRLSSSGKFPKPYTLIPGVTAWKAEEVQAWIDSRQQNQPGVPEKLKRKPRSASLTQQATR